MKSIVTVGIVILVLIASIVLLGFNKDVIGDKFIDAWQDPSGNVNCSWGTEILVNYVDGTSDYLSGPLPTLEIFFRDKQVDSFQYILYSSGSSSVYSSIGVDITNFDIVTGVKNQEGTWGVIDAPVKVLTINMDNSWHTVYTVTVESDELETLASGFVYNLSFTPTGSISYQGSVVGSWINVPLPNWYFLGFEVTTETLPDEIPEEDDDVGPGVTDDDNWIKVIFTDRSVTYGDKSL